MYIYQKFTFHVMDKCILAANHNSDFDFEFIFTVRIANVSPNKKRKIENSTNKRATTTCLVQMFTKKKKTKAKTFWHEKTSKFFLLKYHSFHDVRKYLSTVLQKKKPNNFSDA